jgi:hypothetical protein
MKNSLSALGLVLLLTMGSANAAPISAIYNTITGGQTGSDSGSTTL